VKVTVAVYDVRMADVSVRELKEHLSEYLDRAARGEILRVTDRGRLKAQLIPLPGTVRAAEGWIAPASGGPLAPVRRWRGRRPVLGVLAEDRGE
jgi:prevent-host-death family protein